MKPNQQEHLLSCLSEDVKHAVLELEIDKTHNEEGVKNIIEVLHTLYLGDKRDLAFKALEKFENSKRLKELSITNFL